MKPDRLEYYDPLYETITFERGFPSPGRSFNLDKEDELDPGEILSTAEFCRLAYLRQAGLAWLVFPSATHTRFAHSIGSWWLGRIAESRVKVGTRQKYLGRVSLQKWLSQSGLREEFYLAALLHDIGHGPFSHVLEHNKIFMGALQDAGLSETDHEHRGVSLIEGVGPLAEKWSEIAKLRYGRECKTLADVRHFLRRSREEICLPAIYYLMTGDARFLGKCDHSHRKDLPVVKELVSGLVDIDRLDHAARDSYFSGLRQLVINVSGLLGNLCIVPPSEDRTRTEWVLTTDGARHVASLLFNRRQLFTTMFRNSRYVALTAMANWALTTHLQGLTSRSAQVDESLKIALMEDDQFLDLIANSESSGCRIMGQHIRNAKPYVTVGKWGSFEVESEEVAREELAAFEVSKMRDGCPDVILYYDPGFWNRDPALEIGDWLNAEEFMLEGTGSSLTQHPEFRSDFDHLMQARRPKYLWAFAGKHSEVIKTRKEINSLLQERS